MSFDRGTFWVLPLTYFYISKSARAYLSPQSVKNHYFCSDATSVDPTRPQPRQAHPREAEVGDGVQGHPEVHRPLHESSGAEYYHYYYYHYY